MGTMDVEWNATNDHAYVVSTTPGSVRLHRRHRSQDLKESPKRSLKGSQKMERKRRKPKSHQARLAWGVVRRVPAVVVARHPHLRWTLV